LSLIQSVDQSILQVKDKKDKKLGLNILPTFGATLVDPKGNKVEGPIPTSPGHMSKREYIEIANKYER
jgi:hypothetical protein